jgi:hypothetical protein
MPILTVAEALYGQSSSSDISVLCRISGVSAPVSIVTKTGQTLLLTTIHIGDDEDIYNKRTRNILQNTSSTLSSSSSSTSFIKQSASTNNHPPSSSSSSSNTLISDEYNIINQNVGTFTYWGGLVAEAKLILGNGGGGGGGGGGSRCSDNSKTLNQSYGLVPQVPQPLCTGDIVLLIRVSKKVWMNKTTLQIREGFSKIYVLSRQADRARVRGGEQARKRLGISTTTSRASNVNQGMLTKKEEEVEEEEESDIFISTDQRKEMRRLLSTADASFLLDDIEGLNRIKRLFQMAKYEEPVISSVTLPMREQHGRVGVREIGRAHV